jgi:undecaprenyl diphosphate synthase
VSVIGEREGLEPDICTLLNEAEELTRANTTLNLVVAFNYGGRYEIVGAARRLAEAAASGRLDPANIDISSLSSAMDTGGIPDPDLLIRTGGEQRLSNFLLWQCAYTELVFLPLHWPDFNRAALMSAIDEFRVRERRFGGLVARVGS